MKQAYMNRNIVWGMLKKYSQGFEFANRRTCEKSRILFREIKDLYVFASRKKRSREFQKGWRRVTKCRKQMLPSSRSIASDHSQTTIIETRRLENRKSPLEWHPRTIFFFWGLIMQSGCCSFRWHFSLLQQTIFVQ